MKTQLIFFEDSETSRTGTLRGTVAFVAFTALFFIISKQIQRYDHGILAILMSALLISSAIGVQNSASLSESIVYGALVGLVVFGVSSSLKPGGFSEFVTDISIGSGICAFTAGILQVASAVIPGGHLNYKD